MSTEPLSFAHPHSSRPVSIRRTPSQQHLRIHSTSSSDGSASSPPTLSFVNLSERRGSLRSVDLDPNRNSGGSWNGDLPPSRRGSAAGLALNSKRSGELTWSANKPASPGASRRPSLTPSLSFNYTTSAAPPSHGRGRRPSSSSSAVTVRAGSPSQAGLLPFGHSFKTAAARRSSLTPSTHASHAIAGSPTAAAISIGQSPSGESFPLGSPFFQPSPSRELRSFRFGTSPPPHAVSPATRAHRRPSYEPPDSEDADAEDDDEEVDKARERFREQLVKAGLSSIPISLPTSPAASSRSKPVLGPLSKHSPYGTVPSSVESSASSSHSGSNKTASNTNKSSGRPTSSPSYGSERRPSMRRFHSDAQRLAMQPAAESSSEDEQVTPNRLTAPLRQSTSRQSIDARRLGLEFRKVIRPDDDGSGIEDESDSEESGPGSKGSTPALPHESSFSAHAGGLPRSLAAWDSFKPAEQRALPSPTQELIRHLAPAVALEDRPIRRSISPHQPLKLDFPLPQEDKAHLGLGGLTGGARRGSHQNPSPPRSLSDSAVPRRPSLAEEIQAKLPPPHLNASGAASVGGGDEDIEWDLDFVLGGSGPVSADLIAPEFQIANGMRTARPGAQFDSAALGLGPGFDQFGAPDMQNDSFAQFVRDKDPVFEEMRVAWTLQKPQTPATEWALPTTGGYTYLPSLAAFNSPSRASIASASDAPALSLASSSTSPHVQFRSPDPVLRANRPPAHAWAIKSRGRGWGIVPMQGPREEIKFGPKGKWRTNDTGVRSNRSSLSSKGVARRSSSKDTTPRSRGGSGMSSESGLSIYVPEEDSTSMTSDLPNGQRSIPIPIVMTADGDAHKAARKEKDRSKKKGGWLSAIKHAGSALSTSSTSSTQSRMYSASASSSGSTDDSRLAAGGSTGKEHGNYVPPWLTAGGAREKESRLASKLKFKRRSVVDNRRDKGTSSGGEGGDLSTSLNSRKLFETDDEGDEGEAREGKAWEDVPTEALAMVIPLAVPQSPASVHSPRFSDPKSSPDVSTGNWTSRHSVSIDPLASPLDADKAAARRKGRDRIRSTLPPPRPENSLLVYFVPFGPDVDLNDPSHAQSSTPTGPSRIFQHMRLKKTQSQVFRNSPTPPAGGSGAAAPRPPSGYLGSNLSTQSQLSTSGGSAGLSPSPSPTPGSDAPFSFASFRIVARVVDPSDLTFIPSWPSWESQGPSPHPSAQPQVMLSGPGTNPETKAKESRTGRTDPTVVGVCHGGEHGVEFIREGWERLGFVRPTPDEGDAAFGGGGGGPPSKEALVWGSADEDGESALPDVLGAVAAACVAILAPSPPST